jgi:hypothetical protein
LKKQDRSGSIDEKTLQQAQKAPTQTTCNATYGLIEKKKR